MPETLVTTDWTREQSKAALAEGWDVFEVNRSTGCKYELERWDAPEDDDGNPLPPKFETDMDAWTHVLVQASRGSELHLAAIAFIKEHSPAEWELIDAHAQTVGHVEGVR